MVSFPDSIGQSVRLQHNGLTVSMKPVGVSQSVSAVAKASAPLSTDDTLQREASVYTYRKVYDNHTDIVYTPTFTGVKCDILLGRNTGKNRFDFEVSLNGCHLEKNENEKIIYILNTSDEVVAYFNSVMSYDSVGKVSFGDMEFVYNEAKNTYTVTLIVDADFLNDTETVYPVNVDPSITVSPNQTGFPAFEYMAVYKNGTSQHSSSSSTTDLLVGSSHSKITGRILYRLPSITRSLLSVQLIQCVRIASTTMYAMNAYPYTGTPWTSTSSYASVANNYDPNYSIPIVYGANYGTNTKYMTMDLTAFYNTGVASSSSYSIEKGIELVNINGEGELEYTGNESHVLITTTTITADPSFACFSPYITMTYEPYKIMIDPGHTEVVSQPDYEGTRMWKLHEYLKSELIDLGYTVNTTRSVSTSDTNEEARGSMAANHDLFVSLHSNACDDATVNRVVVIYDINNRNNSVVLGQALGDSVRNTMNSRGLNISSVQMYQRAYPTDNTLNYYAVLRAAAATNCPYYYIIEHSFHSNTATAAWLMVDSNLEALAVAEANAIHAYLGNLPVW